VAAAEILRLTSQVKDKRTGDDTEAIFTALVPSAKDLTISRGDVLIHCAADHRPADQPCPERRAVICEPAGWHRPGAAG
jgi:hypothetical protein